MINTNTFLQSNVNPVKTPPSAEHFLRRVHIHNRQVAAERRRQPAALHYPANRKRLGTFHRFHFYFGVELQIVGGGKFTGHHQRIGLSQKHQRIVDCRIVRAFQIVVAKASVASHVNRKHQNVTGRFQLGIDCRFNHRHSHANLRYGLNPVQHFFRETRLTCGNLQLRSACDSINCLVKRFQYRLIRRVHANEDSHAQHDSDHRQNGPQQMFARVLPTN